MLKHGRPLFFIGILGLAISLLMDTTVSSTSNFLDRINNAGLMKDQQNYVLVSCFTILVGAVLYSAEQIVDAIKTQTKQTEIENKPINKNIATNEVEPLPL